MPFRLCSRHGIALRRSYLPDRSQGDGVAGVTSYPLFQYPACPVEGGDYVRPLKAPLGERNENRKTSRLNVSGKSAKQNEITAMMNTTRAEAGSVTRWKAAA